MGKQTLRDRLTLGALLGLTLLLGCRQTSLIQITPSDATVTMNGIPLSGDPPIYESRSGIPDTYFLKIEQEGYKAINAQLSSSYRADLSLLLLLAGIIPYFFSARLEDQYTFTMIPEE
jgi:hypothetical protein